MEAQRKNDRATKSDKTGQGDSLPELTPSQLRAVDALIEGFTDGEAAEKSGVARQTISRWKHSHPVFIAALNLKRQQLWAGSLDGARSLVPLAVERLRRELTEDGPMAVKISLDILKSSIPHLAEIGPEEPQEVIAQSAQVANERVMASLPALMDDSKSHKRRKSIMLQAAGLWEGSGGCDDPMNP